jgi:hypothetical protein
LKNRFTLNVLTRYEFQAEDSNWVQRILDAFRQLGLGQQQDRNSNVQTVKVGFRCPDHSLFSTHGANLLECFVFAFVFSPLESFQ